MRSEILGGLEVVSVNGKGGLKEFIEFQYTLYTGDPYFVPQPRMELTVFLGNQDRRAAHEFTARDARLTRSQR